MTDPDLCAYRMLANTFCGCDQPHGHAGSHHCPDCGVRWTLTSEDAPQ